MLTIASNVVLRDLRVFYSGITSRQATNSVGYTMPSGITEDTQGNEILHNLIENTGHPAIGSWKGTRGKTIRGNITRFTGFDDWILYAGANRGSGMYLQNNDDSAEALIAGNISYYNYTTGMKAYGNTDIWKFNFKNQICVENNEAGIFFHLDNYGSTNLVITNNYLWRNGTGIRVGYPGGNSGHSNAIVANNYSVDAGYSSYPFYAVDGWLALTWTNNIGVALSNRYVWQLEVSGETGGNIASHTMHGNTYYSSNTGGFGAGMFNIKDVMTSLADWQTQTTEDADAVHSYVFPAVTTNYIFRPSTDTNFVHVAVFNWGASNTISVSLSGLFNTNDIIDIYDAQNIPTAYSRVVYTGTNVVLDCTLTNRATMLGTFTQRSDTWDGFDSRFRAFVLHKVDVTGALATPLPGQPRSVF
jgi:hypothetical protein